jgi:hypothetical protein
LKIRKREKDKMKEKIIMGGEIRTEINKGGRKQ